MRRIERDIPRLSRWRGVGRIVLRNVLRDLLPVFVCAAMVGGMAGTQEYALAVFAVRRRGLAFGSDYPRQVAAVILHDRCWNRVGQHALHAVCRSVGMPAGEQSGHLYGNF